MDIFALSYVGKAQQRSAVEALGCAHLPTRTRPRVVVVDVDSFEQEVIADAICEISFRRLLLEAVQTILIPGNNL